MIRLYRPLYAFVLILALLLGPLFSKKLRQYFLMRLKQGKFTPPPRDQFVILIHAASGEAEYAFPLAKRLKEEIPNSFIVCSYYSPSYVDKIKTHPYVDLALPLPLDLPGPLRFFLSQLRPQLILISRTDVWPEFLHQAQRKKIPTLLFSRTEEATTNPFKIWIKRWIYKQLHSISVVSQEDHQNVLKILEGTPLDQRPHVLTHGDTRWDQAFSKILPLKTQAFLPHPFFVAGSTWDEDLMPLLKAWRPAYGTLVIAPHEIHETGLQNLERQLESLNLRSHRYSKFSSAQNGFETPEGEVLLIDQMGILYKSYLGAYGAFIGGSFKKKVHSVMEALVCQTPVIVGPHYTNNREATQYSKIPLYDPPLTANATDPNFKPLESINPSQETQTLEVMRVSPDAQSLRVVNLCQDAKQLQQQIEALHQRYIKLQKDPASYLTSAWEHPMCKETLSSPSADLTQYITSSFYY
ncbi:MAG: hypothetical protein M9899_07350 [Bdellovibrionaceae bacterium]|nr:hypothetical protein [Pseudobdellovibrionaceae bacterium]